MEVGAVRIKAGVGVTVAITQMPHLVGPASTQGDLHVFGAAHGQASQYPVEIVKCRDSVKCGAGFESWTAGSFGMFEVQPIGTEPIIADMAQPIFRLRVIGDYHAVAAKMRDLLLISQCWFSVSASQMSAFLSNMKHLIKDPPSVHILTDRGLAGAIDYYVRDQILHFNEEKGGGIIRLDLDERRMTKPGLFKPECLATSASAKFDWVHIKYLMW